MLGSWVRVGSLVLILVALAGCRKSMPDLKPSETKEVLAVPPMEPRFLQNKYPKQALAGRESGIMRAGMQGQGPGRPGMAGPGMAGPGMGGMGGSSMGLR